MKINRGKSHMLFSGNDSVIPSIENHTIIAKNNK